MFFARAPQRLCSQDLLLFDKVHVHVQLRDSGATWLEKGSFSWGSGSSAGFRTHALLHLRIWLSVFGEERCSLLKLSFEWFLWLTSLMIGEVQRKRVLSAFWGQSKSVPACNHSLSHLYVLSVCWVWGRRVWTHPGPLSFQHLIHDV